MCSKMPQYDRLPGSGEKSDMPELNPDYHFELFLVHGESLRRKRSGKPDNARIYNYL